MNDEFTRGTIAAVILGFAAVTLALPKLRAVMSSMSGSAKASFGSNDNTVDIGKIGYVTKEGMQLLGMSTDAQGQTTYHYTKRIGYMDHCDADKAIKELNEDSALTSVYGKASFPTDRIANTSELAMMHENKEALGIKNDFIHGEGLGVNLSRYLDCFDGYQLDFYKTYGAAAFPVWRVKRLVA